MALVASLSIDRTALSLSALVIDNNDFASGPLWIADLQAVNFDFRKRYAPDSDLVAGSALLSAVLEASQIPLVIYARGASSAAKATAMATLEAALSQFAYTVTLTIDGVATTYDAEPNMPQWSYDDGMADAFVARGSVVIPVNPPEA